MTDNVPAAVVVLAAGEGKRMKSELAKVLHNICGRSLLEHVLVAAAPLGAKETLVVVGHLRDQVIHHIHDSDQEAATVVQEEQNGTGHATRIALDAAGAIAEGAVVVLPGDVPLLTTATLEALLTRHTETNAAATLLTSELDDPTGYGRIVRTPDGQVAAIVEERDATETVRQLREVGTSIYAFDIAKLRGALSRVTTDNAQGEEYLTDVIGLLVGDGDVVTAISALPSETLGVNDRAQLAQVRRTMRDRIVAYWMSEGVTIIDPETTWMGVRVKIAADATIHQNTQLHGATTIEKFANVGPGSTLRNTYVGEGASVISSHCVNSEIGEDATVGPFAYLRPGTKLGRGAKAGAFTELKNAAIGEDSKVPHLSYVGDAEIGDRVNIGAATVFVNYDGTSKHMTKVGDDARIGSDTMLVAPVSVGDGAYTAAGSVITEDVPAGAMGVGRARQRNLEGWVERKRPGSPAAEAARKAREHAESPATMDEASPVDPDHEAGE